MSTDEIVALADSVHAAGARLIDAIPEAWWLGTMCDLTAGVESIRQAVQRVNGYTAWRTRGDDAFPPPPNGRETALIVADSMAISVAVLLRSGPAVIGPHAGRADRAAAARLTREYMDVRGASFLTGRA
jgi:hypothetical protein